jgi:hypothetical protein
MTKPFLWDMVNTAYHGVVDQLPAVIGNHGVASAMLLGAVGSYASVRILQAMSKFVKDDVPKFDRTVLPALEKICMVGVTLAPLAAAIVDPQGTQETIQGHPVYVSGMAGAYVGAMTGAVQDLFKRKKSDKVK